MIIACCLAAALGTTNPQFKKPEKPVFKPTMESLQNYECPEWFRDAKFGIWAHWGPQSVPMDGDWYARGMYEQGSGHYKYQLDHYGHPTQFGYKDIIPLWKAEKWDPERLMKLYKAAGAKYFVSMGSHHDNFFLWNSKIHRWNSVQMGPHRDVVGEWQKAAKENGLKFGVSEHLGASFTWFQSSHDSDKVGPLAGVPYDGADPANWDLYHFPAEKGDTGWYSNNPKWQKEWLSEITELVDNYHPDLLYSDGGVPFGNEVGLSMISHFYNDNASRHAGKVEAIYNCKQTSNGRWVEDLERGVMAGIDPNPWQTDTSIGDWFYNRNWKFRPVSWIVHTLVDNVSKNGNLLLNVVQRPDGSIDPEVETMLHEMADWSKANGEAIFGTRPWQVYGEGDVNAKGGSFKEDYTYSAKDIRFTTKGKSLYAIAMGWPADGKLLIRSLASPQAGTNQIKSIQLLGYRGRLHWTQTGEGLKVNLPKKPVSILTASLKIEGTGLIAIPLPARINLPTVALADGSFQLLPDTGAIKGTKLATETREGIANLGFWDEPGDSVSWRVQINRPGYFKVQANLATPNQDFPISVISNDSKSWTTLKSTGGWDNYEVEDIGGLRFEKPGVYTITLAPWNVKLWRPVNVRWVRLMPATEPKLAVTD